jgi:hypothetical protein
LPAEIRAIVDIWIRILLFGNISANSFGAKKRMRGESAIGGSIATTAR